MPLPAGSASGIDTEEVINKLVEVERQPIYRLQKRQKELELENAALTEMRKHVRQLEAALGQLTGFEAAFNRKGVQASREGFVSGIANRDAREGNYKFEIERIAARLRVKSKVLPESFNVNAGTVKIGEKEAEFKGGTLEDFSSFLNDQFSSQIKAGVVRVRAGEKILYIESQEPGLKAIPSLSDPSGLFASIDLFNSSAGSWKMPEKGNESGEMQKAKPFAETETPLEFKAGSSKTVAGNQIELTSSTVKTTSLPALAEGETLQSLRYEATFEQIAKEEDMFPSQFSEGPVHEIEIKNITLATYNIDRLREKNAPPKPDFGLIVYRNGAEPEKISLSQQNNGQAIQGEIPLNADVTGIGWYSEEGKAAFSRLEWTYRGKLNADSDLRKAALDYQKTAFPHIIEMADNALMRLDGIEIERDKNEKINDIIDGATLDLHRATQEALTLSIIVATQEAEDQVKNFVQAYNELIAFSNEVAKSDTSINDVGKYDEMQKNTGALVTNSSVRTLVSGLKMHVSNAYPSRRDPGLRTLADIGISTGRPGSKWTDISEGYLEVDLGRLNEVLARYPEAIKDLFGMDSNNDYHLDQGFAIQTGQFLEPYSRMTGGIFTAQIESNKMRMESLDKDIQRKEEHVANYREKMKQRFGYMESNVSRQKSTGDYLKQRFKSGD